MGAGIAAACLLAGLRVALIERDEASLVAGRDRLAHLLAEAERRGKLSADLHADIVAERLVTAVDMAALAEADLIIEAVFESMAVKQDVFGALDRVAKPGAVLATNTSYLDVAAIAAVTARPADVIGLHFFSPAHVMKLLEIVVPTTAGADAVATGFALAKRLGKLGVWAGNAEGFIGNRVLSAYRRAAEQMVEGRGLALRCGRGLHRLRFSYRTLCHAGHGRPGYRLGHPQTPRPDPRSRPSAMSRSRTVSASEAGSGARPAAAITFTRTNPSRRIRRWRASWPTNGVPRAP